MQLSDCLTLDDLDAHSEEYEEQQQILRDEMIRKLDHLFSPDLSLIVEDEIVIGFEAKTHEGAEYLSHHASNLLFANVSNLEIPSLTIEYIGE